MDFDEVKYREAAASGAIQQVKATVWTMYEADVPSSKPQKHGRYFVVHSDGLVHAELWNGLGWRYNERHIAAWAEICIPEDFLDKKAAQK